MDIFILFQQLLVLVALMLTGFISYKTKLIDNGTYDHLSSLMVWILNPFLMISGVIGKNTSISSEMILQNIIMVSGLYFILFLIGFVYCFILKYKDEKEYLYRMEILFPNVGFMGVPLVRAMFGNEYIVLVAFYMLAFNIISYSYGIYLASRYGGNTSKFDVKKLLSPGTVTSIMSIIIFSFHLELPAPIVTYVDFLGNTSITLSMIIIGVFLAKLDWKTAFSNAEYFIFVIADMLIIPLVIVFLMGFIPFNTEIVSVAKIMACMPVASMTCMFTQEYAGDGTESAKLIALTTISTIITAPFVIFLVG